MDLIAKFFLAVVWLSAPSWALSNCLTGNEIGFHWPVADVPSDFALDYQHGFVFRELLGVTNVYKYHAGIDFPGTVNDDIKPTASGTVVSIYAEGVGDAGFGNTVIIDHGVITSFDPDGDGMPNRAYGSQTLQVYPLRNEQCSEYCSYLVMDHTQDTPISNKARQMQS